MRWNPLYWVGLLCGLLLVGADKLFGAFGDGYDEGSNR